mgnify:CR=1 FL=1
MSIIRFLVLFAKLPPALLGLQRGKRFLNVYSFYLNEKHLLNFIIVLFYHIFSKKSSSSEMRVLMPCFTASIGSPAIEPLQSSSRYTGNLLM